jgi:hypothetical protein
VCRWTAEADTGDSESAIYQSLIYFYSLVAYLFLRHRGPAPHRTNQRALIWRHPRTVIPLPGSLAIQPPPPASKFIPLTHSYPPHPQPSQVAGKASRVTLCFRGSVALSVACACLGSCHSGDSYMHTMVHARARASKTNEYLGHSNLKMRQRLRKGLDPGAFKTITRHTLNRREITKRKRTKSPQGQTPCPFSSVVGIPMRVTLGMPLCPQWAASGRVCM